MNMADAHDLYTALAGIEAQLRELPAGPSPERFELDTSADRLRAALAEKNADATEQCPGWDLNPHALASSGF